MKTITLNNGISIPCIGNGPGIMGYSPSFEGKKGVLSHFLKNVYKHLYYKILLKPKYINSVVNAIKTGFYLLDYSASYRNEDLIGTAIKKSGVNREALFLTTRVSNKQQLLGNIKEQLFNTLEKYGTDYVDLYMFHWPVTGVYLETWKQMIELYEQQYCKVIGVANCHQHHIEEILKISSIVPSINQVEVHPLFTQKPLIEYCKSKGVVVEAYTPVARFDDRLVRLPLLKGIAKKYNKTIIQIVLRWHVQSQVIPVVRALNKKHQLENISIFDFELTKDEMEKIDGVNINSRLRYNPDNCDFSIL